MRNRIYEKDTISAQACTMGGIFLASVYDSGFRDIESVIDTLNRKVPYTSAKKLEYRIVNKGRDTFGLYVRNVN